MDLSETLVEIDDCSYLEKELGKEMSKTILSPKNKIYILPLSDIPPESFEKRFKLRADVIKLVSSCLSANPTHINCEEHTDFIKGGNLQFEDLNTTAIHTSFYPARFKDNGDGTYKFISLTASAMGIGDLGYFEDLQFGKKYNNLLNLFIEKNTSFISFILKENLEKICNIAGFLYENNKAPQKYDVIKITDKDISGLGPDEAIIFLPIVKTQLKLNAYKTCIFIKNTSKHSKRYFGDYQEDKLSKDYEFLSYTFPLGHNPSEVYMTGFSNECHDIAAAMKLKMVAGQASFFGNTVTWQIPDGEIKTASGELHAYELSKESYKEKKRLLDKG